MTATMPATLREGMQACPAHEDSSPSLKVDRTPEGKYLLHCFAGCATADVVKALGLEWTDLFPDAPRSSRPKRAWTSPLTEARQQILRHARRQPWARETILDLYQISDTLRRADRLVEDVRQRSRGLTPSPLVWEVLATASAVERSAWMAEADLAAIP